MAVAHRGAISFGMVHIPVGLYTATQDADIHFNQLCKEDGSRIRYKKICSGCGKEVGAEGIIKGFEYEKDKYVTLKDENKIAIAKTIMGTKEKLLALIPTENGILIETKNISGSLRQPVFKSLREDKLPEECTEH